ncbi:MAG: ATP-dependent helicase [Candidatus Omnitrophica bacterium]|nr:ATP-dependent helicase [Candidatus Omnitrophota bacterium]MCF7888165.1 ATP-dependent helicase [Candidatus Omnitrophota bacterium]
MEKYKLKSYKSKANTDYLKGLNPQQKEVVSQANGPALVLAGAGSGKTRVLIHRLAYLLSQGIDPKSILVATFTNRAAAEMTHRAECLINSSLKGLWSGTFHHIGNLILRREAKKLGYSSSFSIVDSEDAKGLIDDCLQGLGYDKKEKMFPKKRVIYNIYSLSINSQTDSDDIIARFFPQLQEYAPHIKKIISYYQDKKKRANLMDFSDLLNKWLGLLQDKDLAEKYSKIFRYILVDEYQDTNKIQFEILRKLSSYHNNILVVGDDAQSIYSFRAAQISNLLDFPKIFKTDKIFKLEINYRSTPQILNLANSIIKNNVHQYPKKLKAVRGNDDKPYLISAKDVYQQAKFVGQRILELDREGIPLSEIAVLFRSRFQALELEMEMTKRNIPYIVRGGLRFFEQAHIKDVISFLKIIVNPNDEVSFKRALSLYRGIGKNYAYRIWENLIVKNNSPEKTLEKLSKRQKAGFKEFNKLYEKLKKSKLPENALEHILGMYKEYCYLSFDNAAERLMDLDEMVKMSGNYSTLKKFLGDIGSHEEFKGEKRFLEKKDKEVITLTTIHQAKGLEWEAVFIIGFCEYDFPHAKALSSQEALEEERRLFYVAVTRTKSLLYITYPQTKFSHKTGIIITRPSMFARELPQENYQEIILEEEI